MLRLRHATLCLAASWVVWVSGCAVWKEAPSSKSASSEPAAKLLQENKRRVVLEVEFINVEMRDLDDSASLWQWVDETAIDAVVRSRLLSNGIRAGFVANQERFRNRLSKAVPEEDVVETFLNEASVASEISHGEKRIPIRLGRRYELPLRQPIEGSHVAMVRVDGETIGRTLQHAQYFLAVSATGADAHKQLQLHLRPEIQHGEARQQWVKADTSMALRVDNRRDTWSIPELDIDVTASEGDTLVLAAASPLSGLAKHMMTGSGADNSMEQLVLLIRIAHVPSAVDKL